MKLRDAIGCALVSVSSLAITYELVRFAGGESAAMPWGGIFCCVVVVAGWRIKEKFESLVKYIIDNWTEDVEYYEESISIEARRTNLLEKEIRIAIARAEHFIGLTRELRIENRRLMESRDLYQRHYRNSVQSSQAEMAHMLEENRRLLEMLLERKTYESPAPIMVKIPEGGDLEKLMEDLRHSSAQIITAGIELITYGPSPLAASIPLFRKILALKTIVLRKAPHANRCHPSVSNGATIPCTCWKAEFMEAADA
jgi:hypothetical protein